MSSLRLPPAMATPTSPGVVPGIDGNLPGNAASLSRLDSSFSSVSLPIIHSGQAISLTLPEFSHYHNVVINVTGLSGVSGAGVRGINLISTNLTSGTSLDLLFNIAPISDINVLISGNNVLLDSFVTDNSADRARARFVMNNGVWNYFGGVYPA